MQEATFLKLPLIFVTAGGQSGNGRCGRSAFPQWGQRACVKSLRVALSFFFFLYLIFAANLPKRRPESFRIISRLGRLLHLRLTSLNPSHSYTSSYTYSQRSALGLRAPNQVYSPALLIDSWSHTFTARACHLQYYRKGAIIAEELGVPHTYIYKHFQKLYINNSKSWEVYAYFQTFYFRASWPWKAIITRHSARWIYIVSEIPLSQLTAESMESKSMLTFLTQSNSINLIT